MKRFTISLDDKLAREFDAWIAERRYASRSIVVCDLFRAVATRKKSSLAIAVHLHMRPVHWRNARAPTCWRTRWLALSASGFRGSAAWV